MITTLVSLALGAALAAPQDSVTCSVRRSVSYCTPGSDCGESAREDFDAYTKANLACGVSKEALPYITNAQGRTPRGTVVLVHGLSANPAHVKHIADDLAREGYNVVAPILHGHGGSDEAMARGTLDEWKADVKFAGSVGAKMKGPLYIMGHSTGGVMAGIEASLRPEQYKAFVGMDPAMNTDGDNGWKLQQACLAKNFWTFPTDVPESITGEKSDCPQNETPQTYEIKRRVHEVNEIAKQYCGPNIKIPPMNYQLALRALCSLARAANEMGPERIKKLPPALTILSEDAATFEYIGKNKLKAAMTANPRNKLVQSGAPLHGLMTTYCSKSFSRDMSTIKDWLKTHR
jgi:esterase/lipase